MNDVTAEDPTFQELVKQRIPELSCDNCGHYPIEPVHGHFTCPNCHNVTSCCDGAALDI